MDEYKAAKMLLGSLSETTLRTLYDTVSRLTLDPTTPAQDVLPLGRYLTYLARLIGEKRES